MRRTKATTKGCLRSPRSITTATAWTSSIHTLLPSRTGGDDLLIEDKDFAVVYNGSVGGTYDIMLKYTEQGGCGTISHVTAQTASDDVKEVAKDMAAEQFAELTHQRMPVFEMPNGDILYARYNRDKDTLDVGTATNAGMAVQHHYPYDHNMTLEANLQAVNEKLNELEEYRRSYKRRNMAAVCVGNGSVI